MVKIHKDSYLFSHEDRVSYIYETDNKNNILNIICVSHEINIDDKWITIVRYDSEHGYLHRHTKISIEDITETVFDIYGFYHYYFLMSKKIQLKNNITLVDKLSKYVIENRDKLDLPKDSNFVVFSKSNQRLNKVNEQLVADHLNEGKNMVRVFETADKKNPWIFAPVVY